MTFTVCFFGGKARNFRFLPGQNSKVFHSLFFFFHTYLSNCDGGNIHWNVSLFIAHYWYSVVNVSLFLITLRMNFQSLTSTNVQSKIFVQETITKSPYSSVGKNAWTPFLCFGVLIGDSFKHESVPLFKTDTIYKKERKKSKTNLKKKWLQLIGSKYQVKSS